MMVGTKIAPSSPAELLGDPHPLLEQLGMPEEVAVASPVGNAAQFRRVTDLPALRRFLDSYRAEILAPVELPAIIIAAYHHASRGEVRELIALDRQLAGDAAIREFALSSCRVGQRQLSKLRPMRDQRVVQRYLEAIAEGKARGWHTIVYGVSLAMFSLPLRQGLQHYAEQTTHGFIQSAARSLRLRENECEALLAAQSSEIPGAIASLLEASQPITVRDALKR
jgi:urease accessory protein UreF